MARFFYFPILILVFAAWSLSAQNAKDKKDQVSLSTSKVLRVPSPGHLGEINSLPITIALSPDNRYAAFLNNGYGTQKNQAHQSIAILDLTTNQFADFPDARLSDQDNQSYFIGLAFSSNGTRLYASMSSITDPTGTKKGDTGNGIAVYSFHAGKIAPETFIKIAPQKVAAGKKIASGLLETPAGTAIPYPAGLAVVTVKGKETLLIANNLSDNAILLDPADGRVLQQFDLSMHSMVPSSFPYTVVTTRDGRHAWCSLWNASTVAELDLTTGQVTRWISLLAPDSDIAPGSHPTAMLLTPDEKLLYVTLANADAVATVDTASGQLIHVTSTKLPGQEFAGSYPGALARSADGKRVFVADASVNAVAVYDAATLAKPMAKGIAKETIEGPLPDEALAFIPTDWYPSALATVGDDLIIATAKGMGTGPNNGISELKAEKRHREHPYIPTLLYGSVSRLNFRNAEKDFAELTRRAEDSNLLRNDPVHIHFKRGTNPIRHVIYILKENRTYDQILGDLKVGNADPSLTMYGAEITPNLHNLALQFGVIDNLYDSGEVSGNGHDWSTAAITTDYNEKTWQIAYRSRERTYDYDGTVAGEDPLDLGEPDVDAPSTGYIWDNLATHGLSYRNYGEFINVEWCKPAKKASSKEGMPSALSSNCPLAGVTQGQPLPDNVGQPHGSPSPWPWRVPLMKGARPTKAVLREHFDPNFPDFNTEYPDQLRADEFLNEFERFVEDRGKAGRELPNFVLLYLPDDHTHGTQPGMPRPAASVADNDLAVGRVVEAVSHSPYWDDTAIFIIEDDAQDGADHVDAHRSIAFVVSKYSPGSITHPFVDSRFYTTVNMMHTMESLLGLPPMNQNDAYAPVMAPLFSGEGKQPPFTANWSNRDNGLIYQINPGKAPGGAESAKMDFTHPDAVDTAKLNEILWQDRKGDVPMPAPRHTVLPASYRSSKKDKD